MVRRTRLEEPTNHERWLVSYADFITILFAFFVVMYSISSVNEDKYRVLSDSMGTAFHDPAASLSPVRIDQLVSAPLTVPDQILEELETGEPFITPLREEYQNTEAGETPVVEDEDRGFSQTILDVAEAEVNMISEDVEERMGESIDNDIINIKRNKFWLEVEIKSSLLFESGSSELIPESVPILVDLSSLFVDMPNRIHIEGFTDDKPINTAVFPSNWELSSARAAAVVRLFERNGVAPARLASIGYGEYQPISDNDTEESRARNRRVVVVVMASLEGHENDRIHEFELLKKRSASQTGI